MARNLSVLVIVVLAVVAALPDGSVAQTRHVVGGSSGWSIPTTGGPATYTNWAANQTFSVGDTLVFNFANGQHNVAKVTKSAFDACNGGNTILTVTSSPASVTLNETGQHYFICTIQGHCSLGQKLAINVGNKASASPAPQPSKSPKSSPSPSPSPASSPASAPAPSTGPVTYTVGDTKGWTVPGNGVSAYTTWASGKNFKVGDILVFNFPKKIHNVEEVTKDKFDSCNSTSPLANYTNPPVRVTLNKSGQHYFICGIPGHCAAGQKLALNVTGTSSGRGAPATSPSPASAATPPSGSTTSPSSSPSGTNPSSPSPAGAVSPPQQNSGAAASLGGGAVVAFSATLLSVAAAAAFFC